MSGAPVQTDVAKQTNPAWGDHVSHAGSEILKPVKISIVGGLIGEPGEG